MSSPLARPLAVVAIITQAIVFLSVEADAAEPSDGPIYELRIYTCQPGKLAALNERFQDHTMKLFDRHGIGNVGYWIPTEEPESATTLIYLLRHKSREAAQKSWDGFRNDPEWKQASARSREEHGRLLSKAPDVTYLTPTDYSPKPSAVKRDRLYELRIYTAAEGKLDALHNRFRQHTDKLFTKHGMKILGYWQPLDEPKSENVMLYIVEHQDSDSAAASWKAFAADPEWQAARKATEAKGRLTAKRPERVYMKPTAYSPTH